MPTPSDLSKELRSLLLDGRKALNLHRVPLTGRYIKVGDDLAYLAGGMIFGFRILWDQSYGGKLVTFHHDNTEYTILNHRVVRRVGGYCPKCGKPITHRCQ